MSSKSPSYYFLNPDDVCNGTEKVLYWHNNITPASPPPASPPPMPNSSNAAHSMPTFDDRLPTPASFALCLEYPPSLLVQLAHDVASLVATTVDDSDDNIGNVLDIEAIQFFWRNEAQAQFQQDWGHLQCS